MARVGRQVVEAKVAQAPGQYSITLGGSCRPARIQRREAQPGPLRRGPIGLGERSQRGQLAGRGQLLTHQKKPGPGTRSSRPRSRAGDRVRRIEREATGESSPTEPGESVRMEPPRRV